MKKNIHKLYVQHRSFSFDREGEGKIVISNEKRGSDDCCTYVDIGECKTEFNFSADNLRNKIAAEQIRVLEQYKKEFMAESQVKINNLDLQIAELKSLESK